MFTNFAIRGKNNSYYPLHVFIIFYSFLLFVTPRLAQLSSSNLLYPVFQMLAKGQISSVVDLTWILPLDCLTMDVECRTFLSDAETVHSSSLMLWSLPTIKPGPRGIGGVGGGGGARAAKSWNSLSFGLKLSYCNLDDSLNCCSCLPQAPKIRLSIDSRALSEFELLSIMFGLCLRIVPWNCCNRSLQR